jgi:HTH-like domain
MTATIVAQVRLARQPDAGSMTATTNGIIPGARSAGCPFGARNPGVRRMRAGLVALGHLVSHKRVHRLMQVAGLPSPRTCAPVLITAALDMAIAVRKPPAGIIFHSGRGCQHTSAVFEEYCTKNDIRRSLGRRESVTTMPYRNRSCTVIMESCGD